MYSAESFKTRSGYLVHASPYDDIVSWFNVYIANRDKLIHGLDAFKSVNFKLLPCDFLGHEMSDCRNAFLYSLSEAMKQNLIIFSEDKYVGFTHVFDDTRVFCGVIARNECAQYQIGKTYNISILPLEMDPKVVQSLFKGTRCFIRNDFVNIRYVPFGKISILDFCDEPRKMIVGEKFCSFELLDTYKLLAEQQLEYFEAHNSEQLDGSKRSLLPFFPIYVKLIKNPDVLWNVIKNNSIYYDSMRLNTLCVSLEQFSKICRKHDFTDFNTIDKRTASFVISKNAYSEALANGHTLPSLNELNSDVAFVVQNDPRKMINRVSIRNGLYISALASSSIYATLITSVYLFPTMARQEKRLASAILKFYALITNDSRIGIYMMLEGAFTGIKSAESGVLFFATRPESSNDVKLSFDEFRSRVLIQLSGVEIDVNRLLRFTLFTDIAYKRLFDFWIMYYHHAQVSLVHEVHDMLLSAHDLLMCITPSTFINNSTTPIGRESVRRQASGRFLCRNANPSQMNCLARLSPLTYQLSCQLRVPYYQTGINMHECAFDIYRSSNINSFTHICKYCSASYVNEDAAKSCGIVNCKESCYYY